MPKNSNWGDPIDKSRIIMFREQYIPPNFEMDAQASEFQMLLSEIEAIKQKAKASESGEWPSRLHKLMETMLKSQPETKEQVAQALDSVYISNF